LAVDKNYQAWFQLSDDLKNASIEDEERDVPRPEDDVTKVVKRICGVMTSTPDPSIMTR
jgi:hypothetical protein